MIAIITIMKNKDSKSYKSDSSSNDNNKRFVNDNSDTSYD